MEKEDIPKIKANWAPMEHSEFEEILNSIIDEILSSENELILKYAKDQDKMKGILEGMCSFDFISLILLHLINL
jgi:hypothetical protein